MMGAPPGEGWVPVVFAADVIEDDICPACGGDYAECACPGPTMDGYEYREFDGVLYGRPEQPDV